MSACRHIKDLRGIPVSEMSDEEILKVAVDRLDVKAAMLIYLDKDDQAYWFCRYKNKYKGGHRWLTFMKRSFERKSGVKLIKTIKEI